jgi:hypothetical protein
MHAFLRIFVVALVALGALPGSARADWIWTRQAVAGVGTIRCIVYGAGLFVAGTSTGYTLSSRDGATWTVSRPTLQPINDIIYASRHFIASTGATGSTKSVILRSVDGNAWAFGLVISRHRPFRSDFNLAVLGTLQGHAIALGAGKNALATSNTGRRWQVTDSAPKSERYIGAATDLTARGNRYFLCSTFAGATIQSSADGVAWTTELSGTTRGPARGIAAEAGGRHLVCVGENGLNLLSSNAGETWRARSHDSIDYRGVIWAHSQFAAFTDKTVVTSLTGNFWTQQLKVTRGSDHLRALGNGAGLTVAVGNTGKNGVIYTSAGLPAPNPTP